MKQQDMQQRYEVTGTPMTCNDPGSAMRANIRGTVQIIGQQGNLCEVRDLDGRRAWVWRNDLRAVY